ncbi:hypothetical protein Anapl_05792 [Anas platyrhynchos]|uniref:Uncharacterized protein n=1 Tax=Anas platyrhynchos TaxID=8839 RepID=R0LZH2_ANAPL|nr:hypothetical protein Anapl_05792 [Anas platyrhynchos]
MLRCGGRKKQWESSRKPGVQDCCQSAKDVTELQPTRAWCGLSSSSAARGLTAATTAQAGCTRPNTDVEVLGSVQRPCQLGPCAGGCHWYYQGDADSRAAGGKKAATCQNPVLPEALHNSPQGAEPVFDDTVTLVGLVSAYHKDDILLVTVQLDRTLVSKQGN